MTTSEFKAWFEGYTENIAKVPTQKQWARIKVRVLELKKSEDWKVVIHRDDRRDYPFRPWWPVDIVCTTGTTGTNLPLTTASNNLSYSNASSQLDSSGYMVSDTTRSMRDVSAFALDMAREIGRDEAAQDSA